MENENKRDLYMRRWYRSTSLKRQLVDLSGGGKGAILTILSRSAFQFQYFL